ncbi:TRAP transporter substrate-binding protein [Nitratireductor luteus]|uniref:TRAP transporter substrate-binding protein n=1 Tax=Nitratireductor luteus TaxID=2976980 RepID=UPI00223F08B9|nr:TRAP transporter substrate-binding protein [Nitratireductor luteus]
MNRMKWSTLAVVAALASGFSFQAAADTWRMAHKMPADSVEGVIFQAVADRIAEKTNGKVTVQVFPNEQLGKDDAILEQLQMGTVHIYPEGSSYLQKWVPEMQFVSAPFLFDDREHWSRFMASDLVEGWHERIETEAGITVIGDSTAMVRGPYRVMVAKKPVESLDDISGLRLRLHPDELAAAAWRHLGAEVRTLGWTEVYESLGRGIVEAVNSPIALVEPMRFYEVAPHVIRHDEYPQGLAFMANAAAWNGLDEETRAQILEAYDEVAAESEADTMKVANASVERMKAEGVNFSKVDTSPFVARMMELYEEMDSRGELPEGFLKAVAETRQTDG